MSNVNEIPDFASFFRMYKQWESENHQSVGPQQPTTQVLRPPANRLSPARFRPYPHQQSALRNVLEFSTFFRALDEVKKQLGDIFAVLKSLQNM
jgi:hypothetical protein